jgi:hypothetical protein
MVVVRPVAAGTFVRLNVESISLLAGLRSARHDLGFRSEDVERRTQKGSRHKTGGQKLDHALPLRIRTFLLLARLRDDQMESPLYVGYN